VGSNLKATAKEIHELARSRKLVLSYVPEVPEMLRHVGGNLTQLLNVVREGNAEEVATGLRFYGHLENGTVIVICGRPFQEVGDKFKEVRIGLFVWEVCQADAIPKAPKRSA
jgi:hypothetical protein